MSQEQVNEQQRQPMPTTKVNFNSTVYERGHMDVSKEGRERGGGEFQICKGKVTNVCGREQPNGEDRIYEVLKFDKGSNVVTEEMGTAILIEIKPEICYPYNYTSNTQTWREELTEWRQE